MKKEVITHKEPKSPISEIFRTLRTNIQFINTNRKIKTLLITSTLPGEGKSWVASNLAVAFAQTGKKVIIIDADMRKGRQNVIFSTPPVPGLSNYLSRIGIKKRKMLAEEMVDCIRQTELPNLYLMAAGSIPPNPSELLTSVRMIKLLDKLRQVFDIVIIDSTPCELVTDAVILSRMVDSTVIVTAHKVTKKDALERAIKNIRNVNGNITGVVVNKVPISSKTYEKKYYYYGETTKKEKTVRTKEREKIEKNKAIKPRKVRTDEGGKSVMHRQEEVIPENDKKEKKMNRSKEEEIKTVGSKEKNQIDNEQEIEEINKNKEEIKQAKRRTKMKNRKIENKENEKKEAESKKIENKKTKRGTKLQETKEQEKEPNRRTEDIINRMNEYWEKEKGEEND